MSDDQKYELKIRKKDGKSFIFDIIRRKYVRLLPEEWVRQQFIHYLIQQRSFPRALIAVEKQLVVNQRSRRTDIVVYRPTGSPLMIAECKAPEIKLSEQVFEQIGCYNLPLRVRYLVMTNGQHSYCARLDYESGRIQYLPAIPLWEDCLTEDQGNTPSAI